MPKDANATAAQQHSPSRIGFSTVFDQADQIGIESNSSHCHGNQEFSKADDRFANGGGHIGNGADNSCHQEKKNKPWENFSKFKIAFGVLFFFAGTI